MASQACNKVTGHHCVRDMAEGAADAFLQRRGVRASFEHGVVVIRFHENRRALGECRDESRVHVAEVGRVAEAVAAAGHNERQRFGRVVGNPHGLHLRLPK